MTCPMVCACAFVCASDVSLMNDACMLFVNANCTCFSYEVVQGSIVICAVVVVEETVVLVVVVAMRVIVAIVMAMTTLEGVRLHKKALKCAGKYCTPCVLSWSSRAACDCRGCGRGFWRVWMCALHWPRHDGHCCGHIGVAEHVV